MAAAMRWVNRFGVCIACLHMLGSHADAWKFESFKYNILLRRSDSVLRRIRRFAVSEGKERPPVKQKTEQWNVQSNPTFDNLIIRSN